MRKHYILDTSVLLHDARSLDAFEDNDLYLLPEVLAELDRYKIGSEEKNRNAREVNRRLEHLTEHGISEEGIELCNGGKLFFLPPPEMEPVKTKTTLEILLHSFAIRAADVLEHTFNYTDSVIVQRAKELAERQKKIPVVVVSKDINLRVRCRLVGVQAADYLHDTAAMDLNSFFQRDPELVVDPNIVSQLFSKEGTGRVSVPEELNGNLENNQYFILKAGTSSSVLVKYRNKEFIRLREIRDVEGIKPLNISQRFLFDACLDSNISIVAGLGKAGTGKTLLSLAAGLHQVMNEGSKKYKRVVVCRPIQEAGNRLGYLPGNVEEKIDPYFKPIETALRLIVGDAGIAYPGLKDLVEYAPITYIRGDTLHDTYLLVDESQNFTRPELKLLGTRMGKNSKIVLIGDPFQSDNPYIDERSNGLTVMTDRLRGKVPEFAYVILEKGERSRIADIFADHL